MFSFWQKIKGFLFPGNRKVAVGINQRVTVRWVMSEEDKPSNGDISVDYEER